MSRGFRVAVVVALGCALGAACSTPDTGDDDLATGRERVQALLGEALGELPDTADYVVPPEPGLQTCRKTFLGYSVGSTGDHRAEIPVIVTLPDGTDAPALLDDIEAAWTDAGYEISHPKTADGRFPKVQAEIDGYKITMTVFTDRPQVTVYSVSPCLAG